MSVTRSRTANLWREHEETREDLSMDATIHAREVPKMDEWRLCYIARQGIRRSEAVPFPTRLVFAAALDFDDARRIYAANYRRYLDDSQTSPAGATPEDRDAERVEALEERVVSLQAELQQKREQVEKLQAQLRSREASEHLRVGQAAGNDVAVFILSEVVAAKRMTLQALTANLTAPHGWIAFAQLWRAGLVDCYGDLVTPTQAGIRLIRLFDAYREQSARALVGEQGNATGA